jgi:uncharacterized protein
MHAFLSRLAVPTLFLITLTGAGMAQNAPPPMTRSIETVGSASVFVVPDMATIRIGVERSEKTSTKAFGGATSAINDVIESMKAQGIAVKDISTSNLALNPVYDQTKTDTRGRPQINGYTATVEISVVSHDIAKIGALLDAALKDGSNQFNGILYDLADKKPALDEARKQAAAEAKRKAELYAAALSLKIGPILRVYEPVAEVARPFGAESRMALAQSDKAPLNVEPGQIEISADVGTIWTIEP